MSGAQFSEAQMEIVRFCAIECELQRSGEVSVACMVDAWRYARRHRAKRIGVGDIQILGGLVEPRKNVRGFRQVPVAVGSWDNQKLDWRKIPNAIDRLVERGNDLSPGLWFREYEEIHPFVDGNGRTGVLLFNWLNKTLDCPVWAPNWWDDPRRTKGYGA